MRIDVSWTVVVLPVLLAWSLTKWLPLGEALLWACALTVAEFATIWFHEMGHIWMGRRSGIETQRMTLRALGGLAHLDSEAGNPRDEILISLAGPATHLVTLAVLLPVQWALGDAYADEIWFWMFRGLVTYQWALFLFNLLPVYPLDGGRVFRGILAHRIHANRATLWVARVGYAGWGVLGLVGLLSLLRVADPFGFDIYGGLQLWLAIWGFQACRRLEFEARHGDIYGSFDPFQKTLRASEAAMRTLDAEEAKERARRRRRDDERRRHQETVDRLLDRITEVGGVDKLTSRERKELERASAALRELG